MALCCVPEGRALAQGAAAQDAEASEDAGTGSRRSFLGRLYDRIVGREPEEEEADALPVPDGVTYAVSFDIPDDSAATKLREVSDLERLRRQLPSGAIGLVARANADKGRLISALEALGYYNGRVDITLAGAPLDSPDAARRIEAARPTGPVPVRIAVTPGKRYTFGRFALIDAATQRPLPSPDWEALGLRAGDPAVSSAVLSAEAALVSRFRDEGYARARVPGRRATVDHARLVMDLVFHVDTGPKARFGPVTVSGTERLDPAFIKDRVPFNEGDVFSPEPIARLRRELGAYDVFESVRIVEADYLTADNELPIEVRVSERLPRFVGFGAKYSTTEGPAANVYWGHRNLFGGAERLRLEAQVSGADVDTVNGRSRATTMDKLGYKVSASFLKPGIFTVKDDLVAEVAALKEITETYTRQGFIGSVGVRRKFSDELTGQIGLDVERARYTAPTNTSYTDSGWYTLVGVPAQLAYDNTGDKLNPTRGVRLSGKVTPYPSFLGSTVGMTKLDVTASGYLPLDDAARYVLAGRVRVGSTVGAELDEIPPPHRFFAGGGGSVRGYDYQSLGPTDPAGVAIGGRSLFEGSAEVRAKVTDTIGVVVFADAGMAFRSSMPEFDETLRYSAGLGLRYYTGIGPIRLDVARGLNRERGDPPYGLYISLGQAF
ncbi:MAG: autotransporter assembly complex protein TamA [Pseudochelatococcus sp.]|jgi:translocation and assembly module TamA|uniref:autotransporter assembly complex protein TamA n=1 Tax=Pseudochelatococcus sp. TaxID=2020869 RepID=UPI003D90EADC